MSSPSPEQVRAAWAATLAPGERLLWTGAPAPRSPGDWAVGAMALVFAALGIWLPVQAALNGDGLGDLLTTRGAVIAGVGLLPLGLGALMLAAATETIVNRPRTRYALTDLRAIVMTFRRRPRETALAWAEIGPPQRDERGARVLFGVPASSRRTAPRPIRGRSLRRLGDGFAFAVDDQTEAVHDAAVRAWAAATTPLPLRSGDPRR
ncbi:hypothetical protein P2H44_07245 [Albimonas sp. CAU 1670]|uniref:hypothetical protein n=1 Tax=Albimonas sp. CAU 1670 TaxID=3032599 RepID=UPI0023DC5FD8|nr:hypothetical protein [Albimonas sp. CAU 1670]MDF2232349.1 hypothetical protein [Albimonas sp. CAU 1670]